MAFRRSGRRGQSAQSAQSAAQFVDGTRVDRRALLRAGGGLGLWLALDALVSRAAPAAPLQVSQPGGYGPLWPANDETTGLPLIRLPSGFRYRSFSWKGDSVVGGGTVPGLHDGMGVVARDPSGVLTLVRNHERKGRGTPFGPSAVRYDARGRGGTTTLRFDAVAGAWIDTRFSLGGTVSNCSGGVTPWGTWLSGEETLEGTADGFHQEHGWMFEVPASGTATARPLYDMGRFSHEAAAVDPRTGFVYMTEDDRYTSGFYRFRPFHIRPYPDVSHSPLDAGGRLDMLAVPGMPGRNMEQVRRGDTFPVAWVRVHEPMLQRQSGVGPFGSFDGHTSACSGPFLQGHEGGGARFRRLEGACYDATEDALFFVDTEGGFPGQDTGSPQGAVWRYDPRIEQLRVVSTSPAQGVLDNPDNITTSPRGGVLMCEDGDVNGTRLMAIGRDRKLFALVQNDVILNREVHGLQGDYRDSEWCGACFDPSGRWLFANLQSPGITLAITGPWGRGPL